jgi:hypothetical protein
VVFEFILLIFVGMSVRGGPLVPAAESPAGTDEITAQAGPKIAHATGFVGMTEAEALKWMYQGIVGATTERGTFEYNSPVPQGDLPQGVSAETLQPVDPDLVGTLRLDLRDSWMVFSVIERIPGVTPEVEFNEKEPTPRAFRLYTWDQERKSMVPRTVSEDEGFNYCMLVLTVTPEGTVEARIFVYNLAFFRVEGYSWQLILQDGTRPSPFRLGGYRYLGALGVF